MGCNLEKADQDWKDNTTGYIKNWDKIFSWGQDIYSGSTEERAIRGYNSANDYFWCHPTVSGKDYGYRPVLEVLNPGTLGADGLKAVMLDLSGGSIGDVTGTVNIVVKNGESFTAPVNNGLDPAAGISTIISGGRAAMEIPMFLVQMFLPVSLL